MATISLCMVVKEEARTLEGAVASIAPYVDEIVIGVDDSSTDETLEIAQKVASPGKMFEFTWPENFAWCRNQAIQRAEGEIIAILDGHEFCPPDDHSISGQMARMFGVDLENENVLTPTGWMQSLREKGMPDEFDVACTTLAMNTDPAGIPQLFFLQPRFFRNKVGISYESAVHNHLAGYGKERAMGCPEMILVHNMPPEREEQRKKQRSVMNFSGLMKDVRREREKPLGEQVGRPWFYMGNSHADLAHHKKAIYWYEQYLKRSKFADEKYQALQQLAVLYHREEHDAEKAKRTALEAITLNWQRAEPYILLAEIALESKQYDEAISWYKKAWTVPAPYTVMFCQGTVYSYLPALKIAECYENLGKHLEALQWSEEAHSWRPGDPQIIGPQNEIKKKLQAEGREEGKNLLILDRLGSFTQDLGQWMTDKGYTVVRRQSPSNKYKGWADIAWFEWCDENLVEGVKEEWKVPVICRLHSYEAFGDVPGHVDWSRVDFLVFVADHIRELTLRKWPQIAEQTNVAVIPNGVVTQNFAFKERSHGNRIGYLGYLNPKKGTDLLLQAARALPEYEFHIAGQFQDNHLVYYFENVVAELPNVWYHGWIDPAMKDEWLEGIDYLLSPSIVESFGYSVAEAMCKGIKPLIHQRPGAIWTETWRDMDELRTLLEGEYKSAAYRDYIVRNFSIENQMSMTEELLDLALKVEKVPDWGGYKHFDLETHIVETDPDV